MKKINPYLFMLIVVLMSRCVSERTVSLNDLDHPRYRYIYDFDSRVSQQKIRNMRAQYQNTAFGLTMLGATTHAYSTASGGQQNYYNAGASAMPKVFRTIWICNQGSSTLYADVLTELATDDEYNASIKEIELPTKKMIGLVMAAEDPYTIQYSWSPEDEKKTYTFSALEQQKIVFTDQGPNRTVIQTDPIPTR